MFMFTSSHCISLLLLCFLHLASIEPKSVLYLSQQNCSLIYFKEISFFSFQLELYDVIFILFLFLKNFDFFSPLSTSRCFSQEKKKNNWYFATTYCVPCSVVLGLVISCSLLLRAYQHFALFLWCFITILLFCFVIR